MRTKIGAVLLVGAIVAGCGKGEADGCSKDSDCKGERVCVAGTCAEPWKPSGAVPPATLQAPPTVAMDPAPPPVAPAPQQTAKRQPQEPQFASGRQGTGCAMPRDIAINPNACATATSVRWTDGGILHHYRELSEMTIQNDAGVRLRDATGIVTWINADGTAAGEVPFTTTGSIAIGASAVFTKSAKTLRSTKIESNATSYKIRFDHVEPDQ
jgi:hypothetical protein